MFVTSTTKNLLLPAQKPPHILFLSASPTRDYLAQNKPSTLWNKYAQEKLKKKFPVFPSDQTPAAPAPRCSWAAILTEESPGLTYCQLLLSSPQTLHVVFVMLNLKELLLPFPHLMKLSGRRTGFQSCSFHSIAFQLYLSLKGGSCDAKPFKLRSGLVLCALASPAARALGFSRIKLL